MPESYKWIGIGWDFWFLILKYFIWSWTQIHNGISSITAMLRIWFNGQKGLDTKQILFIKSPLPYFVLKSQYNIKRKKTNITYCGVKIHTAAPLWCDMNEMRGKRERKKNEIWNIWRGTHLEAPGDHWIFSIDWTFLLRAHTFAQQK